MNGQDVGTDRLLRHEDGPGGDGQRRQVQRRVEHRLVVGLDRCCFDLVGAEHPSRATQGHPIEFVHAFDCVADGDRGSGSGEQDATPVTRFGEDTVVEAAHPRPHTFDAEIHSRVGVLGLDPQVGWIRAVELGDTDRPVAEAGQRRIADRNVGGGAGVDVELTVGRGEGVHIDRAGATSSRADTWEASFALAADHGGLGLWVEAEELAGEEGHPPAATTAVVTVGAAGVDAARTEQAIDLQQDTAAGAAALAVPGVAVSPDLTVDHGFGGSDLDHATAAPAIE